MGMFIDIGRKLLDDLRKKTMENIDYKTYTIKQLDEDISMIKSNSFQRFNELINPNGVFNGVYQHIKRLTPILKYFLGNFYKILDVILRVHKIKEI